MGSIQSIKTSEYGGRQSGKIDASLNEKLNSVEWGEYKVEDLFDLLKIPYLLSKEQCERNGIYPVYSSESNNGGIIGYTNEALFICNETNPIYVIFGDHTRTLNIVNKSFSVLDNVKVLRPKIENYKILLFILSSWKKQIPNLGYARHWKAARNIRIELPIQKGKIDFKFMKSFIAELEAQRIAELEAYLTLTGLKNTNLSLEEEQIISDLKNNKIDFDDFSYETIFEKIVQGRRLKKDDQLPGKIPFVMAGVTNTGVVGYISNPIARFPKNAITIDIFGNAFYRDYEFGAGDDTGVYWNEKNVYSKNVMLFLTATMRKSLKNKFSYGKKLRSSQSLKIKMKLPVLNGMPDYKTMELILSAVQKLVIKDVVAYSDRKIKATKDVIKKTS